MNQRIDIHPALVLASLPFSSRLPEPEPIRLTVANGRAVSAWRSKSVFVMASCPAEGALTWSALALSPADATNILADSLADGGYQRWSVSVSDSDLAMAPGYEFDLVPTRPPESTEPVVTTAEPQVVLPRHMSMALMACATTGGSAIQMGSIEGGVMLSAPVGDLRLYVRLYSQDVGGSVP